MNAKLAGGILLIAGTSIGGGILALPVALAECGYFKAFLLLIGCWVAMTVSAMILLEVTLWLPRNSNMISMARRTLGPLGQIVTWICYLLLLYSLVSAYISGGTDLLRNMLDLVHVHLPASLASVLFTALLGFIIWCGIRAVDHVNRGLMSVKLGAFLLLVVLLLAEIKTPLLYGSGMLQSGGIMVAMVSFGFSVIIPSLRTYFHDNLTHLRIAIIVGSLIPLCAYLLWLTAVMGVIPRIGDDGLIAMLHNGRPVSGLMTQISVMLNMTLVTLFARVFTSICLLTSFLGVGMCLADFLADGCQVERKGRYNLLACLGAMLPPLLIVLFKPDIFVLFMGWAGVLTVLITIILPVMMVWRGRYHLKIAKGFRVMGGKPVLVLLFGLSTWITLAGIIDLLTQF